MTTKELLDELDRMIDYFARNKNEDACWYLSDLRERILYEKLERELKKEEKKEKSEKKMK